MSAADVMLQIVQKATEPLRNRVAAMVSRLVVDAVNDAAKRQLLRVIVRADEVLDGVEHFQPGGLTHVPLPGADGVLLCVGGARAHAVAVGVSNPDRRPTGLAAGETALYAAGTGSPAAIKLTPSGEVSLGALSATDAVSLASLVDSRLLAFHNFLSSLTGSSPLTASALGLLYTSTHPTPPATVASDKVKSV